MPRIISLDFAGTLIKAEVIEEANEFRARVLQRSIPSKEEHANPEELYRINNQYVSKLTGLEKGMTVRYRQNDLDFIDIPAEKYLNQISTNLFQIGMWTVAKEYGLEIVPEGMVEQLQRMKKLGYRLAIYSGVRTDIISGMLQIARVPVKFDYIYGQPPVLGVGNEENLNSIKQHGQLAYVIGDKLDDLEAGRKAGAKTIFVTWGHAMGREEKFANHTISEPVQLERIIRK
jgi:FMN phosphatase YigB (HAD superfamily)